MGGLAQQVVPPARGVVALASTMFSNLLPVLAATSAAGDINGKDAASDADFPGEQPADKELADWLDAMVGPYDFGPAGSFKVFKKIAT